MAKVQFERAASRRAKAPSAHGVSRKAASKPPGEATDSAEFVAWEADFDRRLAAAHAQIDEVLRSLKR